MFDFFALTNLSHSSVHVTERRKGLKYTDVFRPSVSVILLTCRSTCKTRRFSYWKEKGFLSILSTWDSFMKVITVLVSGSDSKKNKSMNMFDIEYILTFMCVFIFKPYWKLLSPFLYLLTACVFLTLGKPGNFKINFRTQIDTVRILFPAFPKVYNSIHAITLPPSTHKKVVIYGSLPCSST